MKKMKAVFPGKKKVNVELEDFVVKTDQPPENGGDGEAPSPFEVFTSSLVACAGFYAKLFCDKRDLDTKDMKLEQKVDFDSEKGMLDKVHTTLYINSEFPDKYTEAIRKSMSQCAVKGQLHPDIDFEVNVKRL